ncbi:universal stress protein, partial [Pedobacter sp.]|uniref:universal stress protein n=1 Tax=Pedobacter sp. TaxID=1411316 RepID=UPI003D7F978C
MINIKKIMIAVDNSTCSEKAARIGYEIAKTFDAEVALVNIIEPIPANVNPDLTLAPVFLETYDNSEENSHVLLKEIEKKYGLGDNIFNGEHTTFIRTADQWRVINILQELDVLGVRKVWWVKWVQKCK